MKYAFALAGVLSVCAGSAYAQPEFTLETCRTELLAHLAQEGIEPTGIQAGSTVTIRGESFVVPLGATPDTLCASAMASFASEQARSTELAEARQQADDAEEEAQRERSRGDAYFAQLIAAFMYALLTTPFLVFFIILVVRNYIRNMEETKKVAEYTRRTERIKKT